MQSDFSCDVYVMQLVFSKDLIFVTIMGHPWHEMPATQEAEIRTAV
jgi:hypothetical protein